MENLETFLLVSDINGSPGVSQSKGSYKSPSQGKGAAVSFRYKALANDPWE